MSAPAAASDSPARRRLPVWVPVALAAVAVALLVGPPPDEGTPLDPDGVGPLGTKALVLLLREMGAEVAVVRHAPAADHETALVLADNLDAVDRRRMTAWVEEGGTLVVADPGSELHGLRTVGGAAIGPLAPTLDRRCELPALREVDRVDPSGGALFDPAGGVGCFTRGNGAFVVATARGEGTIIAVGGAGALVNSVIGEEANAALATALLAPVPGTRVAVWQPPEPGTGDATLRDLVGANVEQALLQLVLAFLLVVAWRARRLGRPVPEPQPVELAASELVVAVGHLLQQARRREQAAAVLSADLRRELAERLGLGPSAPVEVVTRAAAGRTGVAADRLQAALAPGPLPDDDALVHHARTVDAIRQEVIHV